MIVGIGTDIVDSRRIARQGKRMDRFAARILTEREKADYENTQHRVRFLAKRFAVKEAAAKALQTGFRQGLRYCHIGVEHDELGCPVLQFFETALVIAERQQVSRRFVTISDEKDCAVAFVVLEK